MSTRRIFLKTGAAFTALGGTAIASDALADSKRKTLFELMRERMEKLQEENKKAAAARRRKAKKAAKRPAKNKARQTAKRQENRLQTARRDAKVKQNATSIDPKYTPQRVRYLSKHPRGTIVVDTKKRFLYLVEGPGIARRYGVGVGREALAWNGTAEVGAKKEWPSWTPTKEMIKREPGKYAKYADGMPGGPTNPLGARAIYLFDKGWDTFYRIHGTTQPQSIGQAVSNGCIRMVNDHVIDLYARVKIGAKVVVL